MLIHDLAQPAPCHVRVDLRGGNVGVTQHNLNTAQIRAALHQMRGETVPHYMRRQIAKNSRLLAVSASNFQNPCRVIAPPLAVTNRNLLARPFRRPGRA